MTTIEALKAQISDLAVIRNARATAIAKARGKGRASLIDAQNVTDAAIRNLQRQVIAIRRSEACS